MKKEYFISIWLDTRRKLKSGNYPVRLRVFTPVPRKQKLYPTKFEFTKNEYREVWEKAKPKDNNKTTQEIQSVLKKAQTVAKELDPFTFEQFERKLYRRSGDDENVFISFDQASIKYRSNDQIGTASNYELSLRSIKKFLEDWKGKEPTILLFREINVDWLNRYERFMLAEGKSQTTVGIYLRPLRSLFRAAIEDGIVKSDIYPFGKNKYEIPQPRTVKKALTKEQLKKLFEAKPENKHQERAKDFWFFLFNTAGINIKDLCRLRYKDIQGDKLVYFREKTKRTTKTKLRPVVVHLNDYAKSFIKKYGNPDKQPQNHVFDVFTDEMTEEEKFKKAGVFTRTLNDNLQKLAKSLGLPENLSTYWSRHTFATSAVRGGASLEQIQQALNHKNLTTTQNYFAGFEDDSMKELTKNLMDF